MNININDYQIGQLLYFYNTESVKELRVKSINKKTITMSGSMPTPEKDKLNESGVIKQVNEYYDLYLCYKSTYLEKKRFFSVTKKFTSFFRFEPINLSIDAKEKMIAIFYEDLNLNAKTDNS